MIIFRWPCSCARYDHIPFHRWVLTTRKHVQGTACIVAQRTGKICEPRSTKVVNFAGAGAHSTALELLEK